MKRDGNVGAKRNNFLSLVMGGTGNIEHAAIRQGSPGVFAVPPGVSRDSFGLCLEASGGS